MSTAPNLRITADEADRSARAFVRAQNRGRRVPELPPMLKKISDEQTVTICNVGPWAHKRALGSLGEFFIPACPKGEAYAAARPLPGIVVEPIPVDERNFELRQEEGRYVAEQIVGIGKMLAPGNSFVKYGVFIAAAKEPTKKELDAARAELRKHYQELVQEARSAYAQGPKETEATIRETHRLAARELNLADEPWLVTANPEARQKCPACGTMAAAEVILCPNCKFIFDEKKYAALAARFAKQ
ncbi:MAG: hypothetical protein ACRD3Y_03110 [Bryobacteraceae bacterium]